MSVLQVNSCRNAWVQPKNGQKMLREKSGCVHCTRWTIVLIHNGLNAWSMFITTLLLFCASQFKWILKCGEKKMQAYLYRKHNNKQRYRVATVFCIHDWIPSLANGWIALQLTFFFVVQPHSAARCKLHSCNHQLVSSAQFLQLEQRCSFFRFNALRR